MFKSSNHVNPIIDEDTTLESYTPPVKEVVVAKYYFETLRKCKAKFATLGKTNKVTLLMQVGDFYEIYGIEYEDGRREGDIWEFSEDLCLNIGLKKQVIYGNDKNKLYMTGMQEAYLNKYVQLAVEKMGWTVTIYEQVKLPNGQFERVERTTACAEINSYSTNTSIAMCVFIERVRNYRGRDLDSLYISIAYINCITGDNNVMTVKNCYSLVDCAIPFDEVLKMLTIVNPNHVSIAVNDTFWVDKTAEPDITDSMLINAFHLHKYSYNIIRADLDKYDNPNFQTEIFAKYYMLNSKHHPFIALDIDGPENCYNRIALYFILEYVAKHDSSVIEKLNKVNIIHDTKNYCMLANNCLDQLDIINNNSKQLSLLTLLDKTKTVMGAIKFRTMLSNPRTDIQYLNQMYDQIDALIKAQRTYLAKHKGDINGAPIAQLRGILSSIRNINVYVRRISVGRLLPSDLGNIANSLEAAINLIERVGKIDHAIFGIYYNSEIMSGLQMIVNTLNTSIRYDIVRLALNEITDNIFMEGINLELDRLQGEINKDAKFITDLLTLLSDIHNTNSKKKDFIFVKCDNSAKGLYYTLTDNKKVKLEKQLVNNSVNLDGINYVIKFMRLKDKWLLDVPEYNKTLINLTSNMDEMNKRVRNVFPVWYQNLFMANMNAMRQISSIVAHIDVIQSAALVAIENGYVRPTLIDTKEKSYFKAVGLRHPLIEKTNVGTKYVPNDITLGTDGVNGILLFGVNAVGKSSLMKSIGVNTIMAQAGLFVACQSLELVPYNYLFTRIKNSDNLHAGLSSFEVEMKEFKVILKYANERSIILGDELCSGTETQDATALVSSGIMQLHKRRSSFIFATHLHFLADLACIRDLEYLRMCHLKVERDKLDPSKLIYSRKLFDGNGPCSYGILVCETMNMEPEFIETAKNIREMIGNKSGGGVGDMRPSHFNQDKLIGACEVCGGVGVDVHHINEQCSADETGLIGGSFHKNVKWNLVALCKSCHIKVHSKTTGSKLEIDGYIQSSKGIELVWRESNNVDDEIQTGTGTVAADDINAKIGGIVKDYYLKYGWSARKIQAAISREYGVKLEQKILRNYMGISG